MVQKKLGRRDLKSETPTISNLNKLLPFCKKPFEIQTKTSGFRMVGFLNGWNYSFSCRLSPTIWNPTFKKSRFQMDRFQISSALHPRNLYYWTSDPHCNLWLASADLANSVGFLFTNSIIVFRLDSNSLIWLQLLLFIAVRDISRVKKSFDSLSLDVFDHVTATHAEARRETTERWMTTFETETIISPGINFIYSFAPRSSIFRPSIQMVRQVTWQPFE